MKRFGALLVLSLLAACGHPHTPNASTSTIPPKIVPGVPCYHSGPNGGRIYQMDPSIAKALGGYVEVPCP
jgi:hypothetical protein